MQKTGVYCNRKLNLLRFLFENMDLFLDLVVQDE